MHNSPGKTAAFSKMGINLWIVDEQIVMAHGKVKE